MNASLKKLTATAIGIALFVVLALCVAMAVYCFSFGVFSGTAVGALGVVLYCLLTSGLRGMPGWALGNVVIGIGLGLTFRATRDMQKKGVQYALWVGSVILFTAIGILGVKSLIDSLIKSQPFLVRAGMNLYAFVADAVVLILSLPLCPLLDKTAQKLINNT